MVFFLPKVFSRFSNQEQYLQLALYRKRSSFYNEQKESNEKLTVVND